jgi:midasin
MDEFYLNANSFFEWQNGSLITSMKKGEILLVDEISLANYAVIERLNSVLEPSRTLFLTEKGGENIEHIVAHSKFRILATMNPGGDYGKKELSPALRNRFTEIWVPPIYKKTDLYPIIQIYLNSIKLNQVSTFLMDFIIWFNEISK